MAKRALAFLLPVFLGCGGSSISSTQFEDPGADGGTTAESGGEEDGASEGATEDSGTGATDSSSASDTGAASDSSEPPLDTTVPPPDTSEPPPDTTPPPMDVPTLPCSEPGGALYGGHCYFPINKRTWAVAHDFCASLGAHLVTITSKGEQDFLAVFGGTDDRWIGLSRAEGTPFSPTSYKWVTTEAVGYTNWGMGEPNYSGPCVRIRNDGSWADQGCTNSILGICEREP
ncbi:MAG: lectin-like protein [Polyangiales bacterium]